MKTEKKNPTVPATSTFEINAAERLVGQKADAEFIAVHGGSFIDKHYIPKPTQG